MKKSEDKLKVGIEYYLDNSKMQKGIFLNTDNINVYFKKTYGDDYIDTDGVIAFLKENYTYQIVNP
jgi:hypothetical protein